MKDSNGLIVSSHGDLETFSIDFFSSNFHDRGIGDSNIISQLEVIKHYPSLFSLEERMEIVKVVTLEEIEEVLKKYSKGKSPRPDG